MVFILCSIIGAQLGGTWEFPAPNARALAKHARNAAPLHGARCGAHFGVYMPGATPSGFLASVRCHLKTGGPRPCYRLTTQQEQEQALAEPNKEHLKHQLNTTFTDRANTQPTMWQHGPPTSEKPLEGVRHQKPADAPKANSTMETYTYQNRNHISSHLRPSAAPSGPYRRRYKVRLQIHATSKAPPLTKAKQNSSHLKEKEHDNAQAQRNPPYSPTSNARHGGLPPPEAQREAELHQNTRDG